MSDHTKLSQEKPITDTGAAATHLAKNAPKPDATDMKEEALHTTSTATNTTSATTGTPATAANLPASQKSAANKRSSTLKSPAAAHVASPMTAQQSTAAEGELESEKTVSDKLSDAAHELGEMAKSAGAAAKHAAETAGAAIGSAASAVAHSKPVEAIKDAISHALSQDETADKKPADALHELAERSREGTGKENEALGQHKRGAATAAENEDINTGAGTKKSCGNKTVDAAGPVHCTTTEGGPTEHQPKDALTASQQNKHAEEENPAATTTRAGRRSSNLGHHK
jgi:hypothetical protein